jgi:hypothetical protein
VAYGRDVLTQVECYGVRCRNAVVAQARRGLALVEAALAPPACRIPVPIVPEASAASQEAAEALARAQDLLGEHRTVLTEWRERHAVAARRPARSGWSIGSPMLAACAAVVGLGGIAGALLRWALRLRGGFAQIVKGVQCFLDASPTGGAELKTGLKAATDPRTRTMVDHVKRSLGK